MLSQKRVFRHRYSCRIQMISMRNATDQNELTSTDALYEALGSLEGDEGKESLLHSIENLSETEIEILLAQMKRQLLNPI